MSLLKAIKAQLGLSVTPANNFTLDASADNGTMKLVKGPSTNVMEVAADGKVSFPQGTTGIATGLTQLTAQQLNSGTSKDFTIPAGSKRITVSWAAASGSGTSPFRIQIGTGGTPKTTGYIGIVGAISTGGAGSTVYAGGGFDMRTAAAASTSSGIAVLSLVDPASNLWSFTCNAMMSAQLPDISVGYNSLSGVLDLIRFTTINGTDTFDLAGGYVNVMYEG